MKGRVEILKVHAKNKKLNEDVDLEEIAARTPGFSGADLANLLNEVHFPTLHTRGFPQGKLCAGFVNPHRGINYSACQYTQMFERDLRESDSCRQQSSQAGDPRQL